MKINLQLEQRGCAASALAEEAAAVLRAMDALGGDDDLMDLRAEGRRTDLVDAISHTLGERQIEKIRCSLYRRLQAILEMATHASAASVKGAIFQILISTTESASITCAILQDRVHTDDWSRLEKLETTVGHLNSSALAVLKTLYFDDDLKRIEENFLVEGNNARKYADQVIAAVKAA